MCAPKKVEVELLPVPDRMTYVSENHVLWKNKAHHRSTVSDLSRTTALLQICCRTSSRFQGQGFRPFKFQVMPTRCIIAGCGNTYDSDGVSFHRFPKDEAIKEVWVKKVKLTRAKWKGPSVSSSICSEHFTDSDFEDSGNLYLQFGMNKKKMLKSTAIPNIALRVKRSPNHKPTRFVWKKRERNRQPDTGGRASQRAGTQTRVPTSCTGTQRQPATAYAKLTDLSEHPQPSDVDCGKAAASVASDEQQVSIVKKEEPDMHEVTPACAVTNPAEAQNLDTQNGDATKGMAQQFIFENGDQYFTIQGSTLIPVQNVFSKQPAMGAEGCSAALPEQVGLPMPKEEDIEMEIMGSF